MSYFITVSKFCWDATFCRFQLFSEMVEQLGNNSDDDDEVDIVVNE